MGTTELLSKIGNYAAIGREAYDFSAARAPEIIGKLIDARLRYDLGPVDFFLYDLVNRPRSTWRDYLREHPHNNRMLRILHPFRGRTRGPRQGTRRRALSRT